MFAVAQTIPFLETVDRLKRADPQASNPMVRLDGVDTVEAFLLQIDFIKDDFDRRVPPGGSLPPLTEGDPAPQLGFDIASNFLL